MQSTSSNSFPFSLHPLECDPGTYGEGCSRNCSSRCLNSTCNHETGVCKQCGPGYTGLLCDYGMFLFASVSLRFYNVILFTSCYVKKYHFTFLVFFFQKEIVGKETARQRRKSGLIVDVNDSNVID